MLCRCHSYIACQSHSARNDSRVQEVTYSPHILWAPLSSGTSRIGSPKRSWARGNNSQRTKKAGIQDLVDLTAESSSVLRAAPGLHRLIAIHSHRLRIRAYQSRTPYNGTENHLHLPGLLASCMETVRADHTSANGCDGSSSSDQICSVSKAARDLKWKAEHNIFRNKAVFSCHIFYNT